MKTTKTTQKRAKKDRKREPCWPKTVATFGRRKVIIYRRKTPSGNWAFMVSHYAEGTRRFDSFATQAEAEKAADRIVNNLNEAHNKAASIKEEQAMEYVNCCKRVEPFKISLDSVTAKVSECLKIDGITLDNLDDACRFYATKFKRTVPKLVSEVVTELLKLKESRGASDRYQDDLRYRLNAFADGHQVNIHTITTSQIQKWLDDQKLGTQSYMNNKRVLNLLFKHAVARSYAADNPVSGVEQVKVRNGEVEIYTPEEMTRLLAAASPKFLPCLAIGAFAGLRSAEIQRLDWKDIDLTSRHIVVGASRSKTATRRIVPIHDNLAAWLADYADKKGKVFPGPYDSFYRTQEATAAATAVKANKRKKIAAQEPVKWKPNALRHSYASYRFAQIGDAGRVAGELGNSAAVVHRHYRELVKPANAVVWFGIRPEQPANVIPIAKVAV